MCWCVVTLCVYVRVRCLCVCHSRLSMVMNVCDLCALTCVFMREPETPNNTALTKIQHRAFVKVTPIHLAWQQSLYLYGHSCTSYTLALPRMVDSYVESHLGKHTLYSVVGACSFNLCVGLTQQSGRFCKCVMAVSRQRFPKQ